MDYWPALQTYCLQNTSSSPRTPTVILRRTDLHRPFEQHDFHTPTSSSRAVLSATLFSLYNADIPPHADIAIVYQSWRPDTIARRLNSAITLLVRYFTTWKLSANVTKTEVILFSKRRPLVPHPVQFQNTAIPWNTSVKYLGLLDSKLLFTKHLQVTLTKLQGLFVRYSLSWHVTLH
jgi:hypothetical protein